MTNLVALQPSIHRELKIDPKQTLVNQTGTHMIPVILDELRGLSAEFPVTLVKNAETGQFVLVALMGFQEGENLFFEQGSFTAHSMPLNFSRQPFYVGFDDDENLNLSVCIDLDHPAVSEQHGAPVFESNGEQSDMLQAVSSVLATLYQGDEPTKQFVKTLSQHELLTPIHLKAQFVDDSKCDVHGLYTVNEEALTQLDPEQLSEMMRKDYLRLAYTLAASLSQVSLLIERKNQMLLADQNPS